jgi:hypothetical protein
MLGFIWQVVVFSLGSQQRQSLYFSRLSEPLPHTGAGGIVTTKRNLWQGIFCDPFHFFVPYRLFFQDH